VPCPPGWRFPAEKTVEIGRLAVMTGAWMLYEWYNNTYTLTGPSKGLLKKGNRRPLREYLMLQGRYGKLTEDRITVLQEDLDSDWEAFAKKIEASP
jgi:pyruvate ferredoxin oxidoreductase beta subunit